MAKKKPLQNSADDDDVRQALEEVEEITVTEADAERDRHRKAAASIREKAKRKKKMLCSELGIDADVFNAMLADRADDRAYQAKKAQRAEQMPEAKVELFLDYLGQFSWLPPVEPAEGEKPETPAERAVRERIEAIAKVTEEEQTEGAAVLEEMAGAVH